MLANKRKSSDGQNNSFKDEKKAKLGGTPLFSPKPQGQKTPGTPFPKSPKLQKFGGANNVTPNAKKGTPGKAVSEKKNVPNLNASTKKNQPGNKNKTLKKPNTPQKNSPQKAEGDAKKSSASLNRHKRRRAESLKRRSLSKQKHKDLVVKVFEGDQSAKVEVEEKIKQLESLAVKSKTTMKKLRHFRSVLVRINNPDKKTDNKPKKAVAKQNANQPGKKTNVQIDKKNPNQKQAAAQKQNGGKNKPVKVVPLSKKGKPNVADEQEEDDSEESNEDMEEGQSSDEDVDEEESDEDAEEEEDSDDAGEEDQESGSDEEDEDDDDESNDSEELGNVNQKTKPAQDSKVANVAKMNGKDKRQNKIQNDQDEKEKMTRFVVFVGNLPYTATRNEIEEHFNKVGEIVDVRIPTKKDTNKPQGFGYVELKSQESYEVIAQNIFT